MNIDSFYTHGKLHQHKGEDYALHGEDYFIICDGCSSAKHSDVTARLQAHIAKNNLDHFKWLNNNNNCERKFIGSIIRKELYYLKLYLKLEEMPLATLMVGVIHNGLLKVTVYGDGVIVFKTKEDDVSFLDISYNNNAPFYPYYYDEYKTKDYKESYPNATKQITNATMNTTQLQDIDKPFFIEFPIEYLEYLYLFSDGVNEFIGNNGKEDVVKSFTNMKNTNGTFIQRRCTRQLKVFEKERIFPNDDFSMAGIYLKDE